VKRLPEPQTLFGRTALALGLAFLLFGLFSAILLQTTLVRPQTKQAADDLAAFLVLAAQIWVELPPYTRPDYQREMLRRHEVQILPAEAPKPPLRSSDPYLTYLESALGGLIGEPAYIYQQDELLWAQFPMGGRIMRLGFQESRLQNHILLILPLLAVIGLFVAFILSLLLVRRITRPLAVMAEAAHRIGHGDFSETIPETGPRELAELAVKLNLMEHQIGQLLDNRTTLLAGISHDLRTPLARMRLELEMLHDGADRVLVEGLNNDITEMEQLISQALILARGLGSEDPSDVDIAGLLDEIAADFSKPGHAIVVDAGHGCQARQPVQALRRVIVNLVENAVIYSGGKAVRIECRPSPTGLDILVIDRGPGIPATEHEKIFHPFHRLEGSRNRTTGGSGLGLAIVHQLCLANGWRIDLTSPHGATGSAFRVHLPMVATG
jgi:two-component system osmolarity sensor histidine kinase EnvZ